MVTGKRDMVFWYRSIVVVFALAFGAGPQTERTVEMDPIALVRMLESGNATQAGKALATLTDTGVDESPEKRLTFRVFSAQLDEDVELEIVVEVVLGLDVHIVSVWDRCQDAWSRVGVLKARAAISSPTEFVVEGPSKLWPRGLCLRRFFKGSDDSGVKLELYVLDGRSLKKAYETVEVYEYRDFKSRPESFRERAFHHRLGIGSYSFVVVRTRLGRPLSDAVVEVPLTDSAMAAGVSCRAFEWVGSQKTYVENRSLTSRYCDPATHRFRKAGSGP